MNSLRTLFIAMVAMLAAVGIFAQTKSTASKSTKSTKSTQAKARVTSAKKAKSAKAVAPRVLVTPAMRAAAREEIEEKTKAVPTSFDDPMLLASFFDRLTRAKADGSQIHILQFGDSHTASDDWVNAMRGALQQMMGDGGPGFIQAGRPYRGYRRFDALGTGSIGWKTSGTMAFLGDPQRGLSGVSISTLLRNQTVTVRAAGEALSLLYLKQPGGGRVELIADDQPPVTIETDGDSGPGVYQATLASGAHELKLRTLDAKPVRLFGWTLDNPHGATIETLGINGAEAHVILGWDEALWSSEVAARDPALVILAYGTNEANSHVWAEDQYRADLNAVIDRVQRAAPKASILMVGPPDCGRLQPLLHLSDVIGVQRDVAKKRNIAFWNWREHMGGEGIVKRWVVAGLSQADYIHLTAEGYQLLGQMLFDDLKGAYERYGK